MLQFQALQNVPGVLHVRPPPLVLASQAQLPSLRCGHHGVLPHPQACLGLHGGSSDGGALDTQEAFGLPRGHSVLGSKVPFRNT